MVNIINQTYKDQIVHHYDAAIRLPASLFGQMEDYAKTTVFYMLYTKPTLFPVNGKYIGNKGSGVRTEVGSYIVAATVSGQNIYDLDEPVKLLFQLQISNKKVRIIASTHTWGILVCLFIECCHRHKLNILSPMRRFYNALSFLNPNKL